MLDILRKKANSWQTRAGILMIVIVFVFFFGWSAIRGAQDTGSTVAEVNGDPITANELSQAVQNQVEFYQQFYKDTIPENLKKQFQSSALQALIEDRLVRQQAKKMGIRVSNAELAEAIKINPQFQTDGQFDAKKYKEVFRPWFLNRMGIDFEEAVRNDLLKEKLLVQLQDLVIIPESQVKKEFETANTKMALTLITLNPPDLTKDFTPAEADVNNWLASHSGDAELASKTDEEKKAEANTSLKQDEGIRRAAKLADELWPLFSTGKPTTQLLEQLKVKPRDVPLTPLSRIPLVFGAQADAEVTAAVMGLSEANPYPTQPLKVDNKIYLVKLAKKEKPDMTQYDAQKDSLKEKLEKETFTLVYARWMGSVTEEAKIKVY